MEVYDDKKLYEWTGFYINIGLDRLVMMLTNSENIKDVVMFPLMKPNDMKEE